MLSYDTYVLEAEEELLLLNIARAYFHEPPHFTQTSSIQANFSFRSTAGITHQLFSRGFNENVTGLSLGAEVSESPSITLSPSRGKEFIKHFYTPLNHEALVSILLSGGRSLSDLLRLTARVFIQVKPKAEFYENSFPQKKGSIEDKSGKVGFPKDFNQIVSMVSCLASKSNFDLFNLDNIEELKGTEITSPGIQDFLNAFSGGFFLKEKDPSTGDYILAKKHAGPPLFNNLEKEDLFTNGKVDQAKIEAILAPAADTKNQSMLIFLKLKESSKAKICATENNWKDGWGEIEGHFRLRNFNEIIHFAAEGVRTKNEDSNVYPLIVRSGPEAIPPYSQVIEYKDLKFWLPILKNEGRLDYKNQKTFSLFYQISQRILAAEKLSAPVQTIPVR